MKHPTKNRPYLSILIKCKSILLISTAALLLFHAELPLLIFKSFEYKYKKEIKQLIKSGVPEKDLIKFAFHKSVITNGTKDLKWIKKNEFRLKNEMYDIVSAEIRGDSVFYKCIHDFKESELFANFDKYLYKLFQSDSGKRREYVSSLIYMNTFYLLLQGYTQTRNPSDDAKIKIVCSRLDDGFSKIIIPPPKA